MVNKECNLRAGVYKVQTFGTTQSDEVRLKISEIYPLFDGKAVEIVRNIIIDELKMLTDIKRSI